MMHPENFQLDVSAVENPEAVRRIRKIVIPACLVSRPLVVGDNEQVTAIRNVENMADGILAEFEFDEEGEGSLLEYEVEVEFTGNVTVFVKAASEGEAIEMAEEDALGDVYRADIDIDSTTIKRRKRIE